MKELRIKFDFSHGPLWKDKYIFDTSEWCTGVKVIDDDKLLNELNDGSFVVIDEESVKLQSTNSFDNLKVS